MKWIEWVLLLRQSYSELHLTLRSEGKFWNTEFNQIRNNKHKSIYNFSGNFNWFSLWFYRKVYFYSNFWSENYMSEFSYWKCVCGYITQKTVNLKGSLSMVQIFILFEDWNCLSKRMLNLQDFMKILPDEIFKRKKRVRWWNMKWSKTRQHFN